MRKIPLGVSNLMVPPVAIGCMRLNKLSPQEAEHFIHTALHYGANFFDHADIYGNGDCERMFADAIHMNANIREKIILQSKCGIRRGYFDFSKGHILSAVDGILQRLHTDYLDVLLLHRPDALMEPEEVAEAFNILHDTGKVRFFGVSNQKPMQIQLLAKYLEQPIVANQLQFSIAHANMVTNGINVNMTTESSFDHDGSVLDFCRLHNITIQAWSPFQYGFFEGVFLDNDKFPELNATLNRLAEKYEVTNTTIAAAWILRHPAKMQMITGTMNPDRLVSCLQAANIVLTREEWYEIYRSAGNIVP
ncbi:aldo/keto reductase [Ructibacterium gallinarum]|uniref:Aldo/keto reductase n=1 Tax=Ructibacterium gallinarum TaxID=2779355 RepID=A0A9D5LXE4_9FIRM|nr:aldo/keto reductase [Ructibacterium gallinarum]MBE5039618.1 aldo/keto reductase [Ructibacterium gallinarum]